MIDVLFNWVFIGITSYALGHILLSLLSRLLDINIEEISGCNIIRALLGLAAVTVYAEVWSLFGPVGAAADYILVAISLLIVFLNRNAIVKEHEIKPNVQSLICAILILVFAYGTSRGYMHFDTNLYHAQAIRWIEEYGIVPGLANLQSRFGYNSAEFALNALYSCKWLLGRSLHCTAGYFALISSFLLLDFNRLIFKDENNRISFNIRVSDFVRLGLIFYLATIYAEMISPASDYYAQLLILDITILWLDNLESKHVKAIQGILCLILVYAVTIKLSLGLLVFLALIPGVTWIKEKNTKPIIAYTISGLVVAIPYFVRNYIISGWILYPSTIIKLGSPDWQLPKGEAQYDAREIGMWGRGVTSATEWDEVTFTNWIPSWISNLSIIEIMWVFATFVAIIVTVILTLRAFRRKQYNQILLLLLIYSLGTVFWFCSAPLVRYGYAYLVIMPLMVIGYVTTNTTLANSTTAAERISISQLAFYVIAFGIIALKGKSLVEDIIRTKDYPYYFHQQDYIDGEATTYTIDGITIYVAEDAGQIGYYKFPASPEVKTDIKLRGDDLPSGFMKR